MSTFTCGSFYFLTFKAEELCSVGPCKEARSLNMIICHFLPFAFAVVIEKDDQKSPMKGRKWPQCTAAK